MVTWGFSVYLWFLWLPGVSTGEDGSGAQQFFIQISAWHRERRVLGQQHASYGQQSLKSTEITSVRSLKKNKNWLKGWKLPETFIESDQHPWIKLWFQKTRQVVIAHFRITLTESECFDNRQKKKTITIVSFGGFTSFFIAHLTSNVVFENDDICIRRCVFNHTDFYKEDIWTHEREKHGKMETTVEILWFSWRCLCGPAAKQRSAPVREDFHFSSPSSAYCLSWHFICQIITLLLSFTQQQSDLSDGRSPEWEYYSDHFKRAG